MKILQRVMVGLLMFILSLLLVVFPFLAFLGAGAITDSPIVAGVISLVVMFGICLPVVLWVSRRIAGGKRPWIASGVVVAYLLLTGVLAFLVFVRPLPGVDVSMPISPTGYWELATGSKIAYLRVPARGTPRATPVIRIHGGFSIPDYVIKYDGRPNPRPLDGLAEDGFDVYYYDQVGSGNSARLSDPREYSIRRAVQDLEAIRQVLGAEQIVLIGLSWGSTLAAQYCAAYPNRVAKVLFESPGHLWSGPYPNGSDAREDRKLSEERMRRVTRLMWNPRVVFGGCLYRVNPQLTVRIAPDHEVSRFLGLIFMELGDDERTVCDPLRLPPSPPLGLGAYAFLQIAGEYERISDPRAALSTNPVPVLVMRGACEWLKPEVAQDYVQAFPNSTFTEIEKGGHLLYLEQPEVYLRTIRGFLLDKR